MADVATARKGHLSLLTYDHRMLQHPRMLLCLCSFAGVQCAAHSPGHALCAAQQGQADVCGCFREAQGLVWHFSPNLLRLDLFQGAEGTPLFACHSILLAQAFHIGIYNELAE
jgi:hypothetical protein